MSKPFFLVVFTLATLAFSDAHAEITTVKSLSELAAAASQSGLNIRMEPGVYKMADYLTDEVIAGISKDVPKDAPGRPPTWMLRFSGSNNTFDLRDVVIEIDTTLYAKLPRPLTKGYTRCLFVTGTNNRISGLTVRNTGPLDKGSNGNTFSLWGENNTLENVSLYVSGSSPYGYGDLLGKGGPNLVGLQKQSGFMIAGTNNTLTRCRVISRAFGHCFYIQNVEGRKTDNIRLEDCYAEGSMRSTASMLRETSGLLAGWNYRTIAENRDGRFLVVAGYMKALGEDGFRTYGGTGQITLLNCTAINTRAGFEINGPDDGEAKTLIDGGTALGCERAFLLGSNVNVRRSRGDTQYGPLLYLRGGHNSDVELELVGEGSDYTVHCLATIAGENHRVHLFTNEREKLAPSVPIMLGFAMPANAEMASPIRPADAKRITLTNELDRFVTIQGVQAADCEIQSKGLVLDEPKATTLPVREPSPATHPQTK